MNINTELFTLELTNDTFTINQSMGVMAVSVFCKSATAGTVTGTATLGGVASSALTVEQNQTVTVTSVNGSSPVVGVVITAPSGCTLQIEALV